MCLPGAQKWDARDNARVFVTSLALYLTQRPDEVRVRADPGWRQ